MSDEPRDGPRDEKGWVDALAAEMGVSPLTASETDRLLKAAREVAHRTERKATPLAAFLMGMGVATWMSEGKPRQAAFDDGIGRLMRALPQAGSDF